MSLLKVGVVILILLLVISGVQAIQRDKNQSTWYGGDKNNVKAILGQKDKIDINLSLSRWDGQVGLTLVPQIPDVTWSVLQQEGDKVTMTCPGCSMNVSVYPLTNGLEYELTLKNKPPSNIINFTVNSSGLNWLYQDELWKDMGMPFSDNLSVFACNATFCYHQPGGPATRPPWVVGSYQLYANDLSGDYTGMGGMNYGNGKFGSLNSTFLTDAKGAVSKAITNLSPDGKTLIITVDNDWLNSGQRKYPIAVDPAFGYDQIGASSDYWAIGADKMVAFNATAPESGTIDTLHGYGYAAASGMRVKAGVWTSVYPPSAGIIIGNGSTQVAPPTSWGWMTIPIDSNAPAVVANSKYYIGFVQNSSYWWYKYDTDANSYAQIWNDNSFTSPTNIGTGVGGKTQRGTFYANYTLASSPPEAAFSCSPTAGVVPFDVTCTDASKTTITTYNWTVSNRTGVKKTSSTINPIFNISFAGEYNINLTVTNASGSDDENKTIYLTARNPAPTGSFLFGHTHDLYTNLSYGNILDLFEWISKFTGTNTSASSYYWEFNDGNTSTSRNGTKYFPCTSESCYYTINHRIIDSPGTNWTNTTWSNQTSMLRIFKNVTPTVMLTSPTSPPIRGLDQVTGAATITFVLEDAGAIKTDMVEWDAWECTDLTSAHTYVCPDYGTPGHYDLAYTAYNYTLGTATPVSLGNFITILGLPDAIDNSSMDVSSRGIYPENDWYPRWKATNSTSLCYYDNDCAQSGVIHDTSSNELWNKTSMNITIAGPVNLSWWQNVSSEADFDYLRVYINGTELTRAAMSGVANSWTQYSYELPTGIHDVCWTYLKDGWTSEGLDSAFVDRVEFSAAAPAILPVAAFNLTTGAGGCLLSDYPTGGNVTIRGRAITGIDTSTGESSATCIWGPGGTRFQWWPINNWLNASGCGGTVTFVPKGYSGPGTYDLCLWVSQSGGSSVKCQKFRVV